MYQINGLGSGHTMKIRADKARAKLRASLNPKSPSPLKTKVKILRKRTGFNVFRNVKAKFGGRKTEIAASQQIPPEYEWKLNRGELRRIWDYGLNSYVWAFPPTKKQRRRGKLRGRWSPELKMRVWSLANGTVSPQPKNKFFPGVKRGKVIYAPVKVKKEGKIITSTVPIKVEVKQGVIKASPLKTLINQNKWRRILTTKQISRLTNKAAAKINKTQPPVFTSLPELPVIKAEVKTEDESIVKPKTSGLVKAGMVAAAIGATLLMFKS